MSSTGGKDVRSTVNVLNETTSGDDACIYKDWDQPRQSAGSHITLQQLFSEPNVNEMMAKLQNDNMMLLFLKSRYRFGIIVILLSVEF